MEGTARPSKDSSEAQNIPLDSTKWIAVVEKIQNGDPEGMEQLYVTIVLTNNSK